MSDYPMLATRLFNQPLLVLPDYLSVITSGLAERLNIEPIVDHAAIEAYTRPNREPSFDSSSGIMTLPVVGTLVHRGTFMSAMSGSRGYAALQNQIGELIANRDVRGIMLDIDSGGGEVGGLYELGAFLQAAQGNGPPIWSICNACAASAAYWLAASTERIFAVPGAHVGSIGVVTQHMDASGALEKKGVVSTIIHAGKHKVDGNQFMALSDAARADMQARVDSLYQDFVSHVAAARGMTEDQVRDTEARVYQPDQAKELGLIDGKGTLGEALRAMSQHVNRPVYQGYRSNEASMSKENLIYGESDLASARSAGHEAGVKATTATFETQLADAKAGSTAEFCEAIATMFPEDARAALFAEAVADGVAVPTAAKLAGKITARAAVPAVAEVDPKVTKTSNLDALMARFAPGVGADAGGGADADPKLARIAELKSAAASLNASRGNAR